MTEHLNCRICGKTEPLTEDHVPPRALQLYLKCEDWVYYNYFGNGGRPKFKQKGTSFRSVCASCNNTLLGGVYDPELVRVCKLVIMHLNSMVIMSPERSIQFVPFRFCRSVVGHFLAARRKSQDTKIDQILREYFWGMRTDLGEFNIFYWPYQYDSRIIIRDIAFKHGVRTCIGGAIKFYPMAFFLVDAPEFYSLRSLRHVMQRPDNETAYLGFNVRQKFHEFWPEHTDFRGMVFGGEALQDAVYSKPRRRTG